MNNQSKKDFGSIFITNTAEKKNNDLNNCEVIVEIEPSDCVNWKYADRQSFEMGDLQDLATSILENGQVQPIVVRKSGETYEVIAGERRWRACFLVNKKVKAVIKELTDEDAFILQASENTRQDLSSYSQSISYNKILSDEKISQRELAKKIGISKTSLNNLLAYAFVPTALWDSVGDMRKVTIKTACFIKKIVEDNPELLDELIKISSHIQKGAGTAKIKKLLEKESHDSFKNIYSSKNKILFKLDRNKIILPVISLEKNKLEDLIIHIKTFLESHDL